MSKPTITINLHPLAWRVLRREYIFDGYAVDLGKSWVYNMVAQGLQKKQVITATEIKKKPSGMVEGRIYIYEENLIRFGGYIRLSRQANISAAIYKVERERLCNMVAIAHCYGGVPKDTAMRYFLEKYDYDEGDLPFATLKKYYQRHYADSEIEYETDIEEIRRMKKRVLEY